VCEVLEVIPLYHHDKITLQRVLHFVRKITHGFWLHIFDLPHMGLLHYYLHEVGIDSVDTSALLYITARRRYLMGSRSEPVRNAALEKYGCDGCRNLKPEMSTISSEFFLNFYIHNLRAAATLSAYKEKATSIFSIAKRNTGKSVSIRLPKIHMAMEKRLPVISSDWKTAQTIYEQKKRVRKNNLPLMTHHYLNQIMMPEVIKITKTKMSQPSRSSKTSIPSTRYVRSCVNLILCFI